MSCCGPMIGMISLVNRRVSRSFSPMRELLGVADDAALGAAVGQVDQAFFQVWSMARAMTSSMLTAGS